MIRRFSFNRGNLRNNVGEKADYFHLLATLQRRSRERKVCTKFFDAEHSI